MNALAVSALVITLLTGVVGLALFAAKAIDGNLHSAPAWIEALATAAAFGAAVVAGSFAYGAFRLENDREYDFQVRLRAEQAKTVAAWYGTRMREIKVDNGPSALVPEHGVWLVNGSSVPVTGIRCDITHVGLTKGANAPTPQFVGYVPRFALPPTPQPMFMPFEGATADHFNQINNEYDVGRGDVVRVDVDLVFTDSAGVRWTRFADGGLSG